MSEAEGNVDFDAGFTGTPTETPEIQDQQTKQEAEPKYRQITEDEYAKLSTAAAAVDELKATVGKQFDTAFGKMGGLERVIKQYQDQTGVSVEITEDDFAELRDEYPDLLEPHMKALQRVAGKLRGPGRVDESSIQPFLEKARPELVEHIRREVLVQDAKETLSETHPEWESVIGNSLENKPGSPEFFQWFAAQPQEYQSRLNGSWNPVVIGRAIDKFTAHQESLKKKAERQDRFDQAVTPKGDGGYEPPTDNNDAFNAGFNGR